MAVGPWPSAGADAAPLALTCAAYCAAIQAACTMENQQYGNLETCETGVPAFAVGARGDVAGDSLGCRLHHTELAAAGATAAATYCRQAGPGGDGVCGENCGGACDLINGRLHRGRQREIYDSRAACLDDCAAHGSDAKYTSGDPGRTDQGNQVACQLYHAVQATAAPEDHCRGDLALTAYTCRE